MEEIHDMNGDYFADNGGETADVPIGEAAEAADTWQHLANDAPDGQDTDVDRFLAGHGEVAGHAEAADETDDSGPVGTSFDSLYAIDAVGNVRPRDPIAGTVLRPGEMPDSLMQDPDIQKGEAFWEAYGSEVRMRVLAGSHTGHEGLEASGIDVRAEAQRLAANGGVLLLEGISSSPAMRERSMMLYRMASGMPEHAQEEFNALLQEMAGDRPDFQHGAEVCRQIMGTGVAVEAVDFIRGGERIGDIALTHLEAIADATRAQAKADQSVASATLTIPATVGFDMYRDMNFVGRSGAVLADRHQPGRVTEAAWLGGMLHRSIGTYMFDRGAEVSYARGPVLNPIEQRLLACNAKGVISLRDLSEMLRLSQ